MKGSNLGVAVIALVIGAGIGFFVGKGASPTDLCLTPGDHIIDVDQNGTPSCPAAAILRGTTNRVTWLGPSGKTLGIVFRSPLVPQAVCPPSGTSSRCNFGPVNATVPPADYWYDVHLNGQPTGTNGRIIIKK